MLYIEYIPDIRPDHLVLVYIKRSYHKQRGLKQSLLMMISMVSSRSSRLWQSLKPGAPLQVLRIARVEMRSHVVHTAASAIAEELVPPVEGAARDAVSPAGGGRRGAEPKP